MADENGDGQKDGPRFTHTQTVNRQREITTELVRLGDIDAPSEDDERYFNELDVEFHKLDEWRKSLERQARLTAVREIADGDLKTAPARLGRTPGRTEAGSFDTEDRDAVGDPDSIQRGRYRDPWKLDEMRTFGRPQAEVTAEYRSRALSAIENMQSTTDRIRSTATELVEKWDDEDGRLSRLALALSEPTYLRAWSKLARDPVAAALDADERAAIDRVKTFARAMSLTDSQGGYLVPFQLDPTLIMTSTVSVNQIRRHARQVIATGDVWHGVSSGAVNWSYDGEAQEVSDDSPTLAQPEVPVYKAQGFVPISVEAWQDAANVTTEVGRLLARGKDNLESSAFVTGTGSNQPTGLITALVAAGGSTVVASAAADTFALGDVYALDGALAAEYHGSPSTAWLGSRLIYNKIRQFDTAGGAGLFADNLRDGIPGQLLNHPVAIAEAMDGVINAAAENYVLVVGDFENYVIADRIGTTVEFIPHLFGAAGRPTGQRGWYAYVRHGAGVVNSNAFRLLNVT